MKTKPSISTIPENRPFVLGIDPGLSGALAYYDSDLRALVAVFDMPTYVDKKGKKHIELYELATLIDIHAPQTKMAVIERVGARPGQGVTSMFRFGYAAGAAAGCAAASMLPMHFVEPSVWKSLMGLSHQKELSLTKAINQFPSHSKYFSRKKDDGRAEAALLALFGAERLMAV